MLWYPTKSNIQDWFDQKARDFVEKENQISRLTIEEWLESHIYFDIHEYFFVEFSIILYEWLAQLTFHKMDFQGGKPTYWTPNLFRG